MILLDAVYINNGGGLVLLKYLIDFFEKKSSDVFYLLDSRVENYFNEIDVGKKEFISNSILERHLFYKKNKDKFDKVVCFGNLPPTVRLNAKVLVYFHQLLFLKIPKDFSFKNKIIYYIKQNILNFLKSNADLWLVQSEFVRLELSKKYFSGEGEKIIKLPFYPGLNFSNVDVQRTESSFLYISNSSPHKNYYKLIEAFCLAYESVKMGSLTVTVPDSDIKLCELIHKKNELGYPIINVGFIDREKLVELYLSHEYLIFPSLAESFGLGLAEAIDGGCKVIAADLNYTYEVCEPSLVFDPYSIDSMKNAIVAAVRNDLAYPKKLIENDISKIMQLLAD